MKFKVTRRTVLSFQIEIRETLKGIHGCRAKKYCSIEFFFHISTPRCPLQHILFSWSLTLPSKGDNDIPINGTPFVENVKYKVKFGFC